VTPQLRRATPDDLPAITVADGRSFGIHYTPEDLEDFRTFFDLGRFLLACDPDDGTILGVTASIPFEVTLPGGRALPAPGVTWVSVAATHRRRGILRTLMAEQHQGFVAEGVAVSYLTASEGGIYGRFGYGRASTVRSIEINRRLTTFRRDAPDPGGVRLLDSATARTLAPEVHRRWCAITPGAVSRSALWWDDMIRDRPHRRHGDSGLFHLIHPDGYASYRMSHGDQTCRIVDLFAVTAEAHTALWRVLLGLDLVEKVAGSRACALDDPLPLLLADARQVRTTDLSDGIWARILDVPAALAARTYAVELDVVVEVADGFLGRGGRFRLRGGPDGATCEPSTAGVDLSCGIAALGSLLFGAERANTLARAGAVEVSDAGVLRRVDAAFTAERAPQHGTPF
jgi:predicted acetyltransferase